MVTAWSRSITARHLLRISCVVESGAAVVRIITMRDLPRLSCIIYLPGAPKGSGKSVSLRGYPARLMCGFQRLMYPMDSPSSRHAVGGSNTPNSAMY